MKVLIVFNHPAPYKVKIFNELAKLIGLTVIFERTHASDRPRDFYHGNDIRFHHIFLKKCYIGAENTYSLEVRNYIKKHHKEYDLIIMNGYSTIAEMLAINYMRKKKIPFTLYINGGVIKNDSKFKYSLKKKYISSANYYISPCEEADRYLVHYGANKDKIFNYTYSTFYEKDVLSMPLSTNEKKIIREKYNLPIDKKIFISASQFIERKNIKQLLQIFSERKEILLLVGSGPQLDDYLSYIKENNLSNIIIKDFMKRDELFEIMSSCDHFITLSKEDIYGHTTNEAMARGLSVISSNKVLSSIHLIKNGVNGYLVDLNDNKNIHDSIDLLNEEMAKNALITARENTIEEMAKNHASIFKRIIK